MGSSVLAAVPVVNTTTPVKDENNEPQKPHPMKLSDLPVYEAPHAEYGDFIESKEKSEQGSVIKSTLITPIRGVREQFQYVLNQTVSVKNTIQENVNELQDRTAWIVKYLREEENKEQRLGAVAMGGLTGFIFGLRGGVIRRVFYATVGTGIMGSICFPEKTSEIAGYTLTEGRHYVNVAYNFFYGVKPGDPQLEVKFPELSFPKDFSEFVDLSLSLASSVKQAIMPPPSKEANESKPVDKTE
ncbi:MICOS complex subunit MIC27 [Eumeta japonica]|uniref:MICOS complex subunit n=1 Tax=Eumeta variegata TaxID=151549 RepID=A0A4C1XQS5_EUMVA|nr:MICOS complex subunit MIC27 [Eumeta japonica]